MSDAQDVRQKLVEAAPTLWNDLSEKAAGWTHSLRDRLKKELKGYTKTFNDPVWGDIVFFPWETLLLDSPLLQRLRGVRQLGMAHLVYPGAMHDRLEHSRGVVEAAERMISSLERNADFRRNFGRDKDDTIPSVSSFDRRSIRLAALLHDIGHGAYSHATEQLIRDRLPREFDRAELRLRESFSGVTSISPGEIVAVILILSDPLRAVFESPHLGVTEFQSRLPLAICARILGARDCLDAGYLSGIVSGPLDADKLDYMARDCHHAGLPIGLDLHRLISKLEVVTVTPESTSIPEMRQRALSAEKRRYHDIGISLSGLGAYEQLIVSRAMLYDRLYYHHKVRAAEAMIRELIQLAEHERGALFTPRELFFDYPDDTVAFVLGGRLVDPELSGGKDRSRVLSDRISNRDIYYRAFAFAPRFISGQQGLPDQDRRDSRALLWRKPLAELATTEGSSKLAAEVFELAQKLFQAIPDIRKSDNPPLREDVVADLPLNRVAIRGGDILTRTEDGYVSTPNLFFDPERWSQAYEHQKQCGFVFTPRQYVPVVGLASRIVFFEKYSIVMDASADRASKTERHIKPEWFDLAVKAGLCPSDCALAYRSDVVRLVPIDVDDLKNAVPADVMRDDPLVITKLYQAILENAPSGFAPRLHAAVLRTLRDGFTFIQGILRSGKYVGLGELAESKLQEDFRSHLMSREATVVEGTKEGGGETDLVIDEILVIENKVVRTPTADPLNVGERFSWQTRRYAVALAQRVAFQMVAYKPSDESQVLPVAESIGVSLVSGAKDEFVVIRFVVPWGLPAPSKAKVP